MSNGLPIRAVDELVSSRPENADKTLTRSRWAIWCHGCTDETESKTIGLMTSRECPKCGKMNAPGEGIVQQFDGVFPSERAAEMQRVIDAGLVTPASIMGAPEPLKGEWVAEGTQAPAAVIRGEADELFETIEAEEDIVKANMELLEGRALTDEESKRWTRLVHEIQRECNVRLKAKGIVLLAGVPEPNGLGFVLTGCDKASVEAAERGIAMPSEDYVVTVTLPARERVDIARTEREEFVRKFINLICSECIEQQKAYRAKREFFN